MPNTHHEHPERTNEARTRMSRAVNTRPADEWFYPHALALLTHARVPGPSQDDLLVVMQPVRLTIERYAVQHGVPEVVLAETAEAKASTTRRGHFEHDLVHAYLPEYLARVDCSGTDVSFCRHAQGAYEDALRQRRRRERHRKELWRKVPGDVHNLQEVDAPTDEEPHAVTTGATYLAHWVPTPDQVHESLGFLEELERMLEPLDCQIAELIMKHGIVQGDRGEIARLLSISPSRMTRAINNIREAVVEILRRRGIRRR